MATPPAWAYPYATVWDDFAAPAPALLDSQASGSGGSWVQSEPGTDWRQGWRGLSGYSRSPVGGGDPSLAANAGVPSGTDAQPSIAVPGATSSNAFIKADVYLGHTTSYEDANMTLLLLNPSAIDNTVTPDGLELGFFGDVTDGFAVQSIVGGSFTILLTASTPLADIYNGWHSWEMRVTAGLVSVLFDDAVVGVVSYTPTFDLAYAQWRSDTRDSSPGDLSLLANFQAGPVAPLPRVPQLSVGQGPQHVRFESPRPI